MRLDQLHIVAYRALRDLTFDFTGPGLHLIHGRNEAGKSTTRQAITDVLYGPAKQGEAFAVTSRHPIVGARISTSDGTSLTFQRTLNARTHKLHTDGQPLPEDALVPYLNGIDRAAFVAEFALHAKELREGGALLVEGNGDLAQALTATRSGMRMTKALERIEARKDALYRKQAKVKRINKGLADFRAAQTAAETASLRTTRYTAAEQDLRQVRRATELAQEDLKEARRILDRRVRLQEALPLLEKRAELLAEVAAIRAAGPIASAAVAARLPALHSELQTLRDRIAEYEPRVEGFAKDLAELRPDQMILASADQIEELADSRTAMVEAEQLVVRLQTEGAKAAEAALAALHEVHLDAELADIHLYRFPLSLTTTAAVLRDERRSLDQDLRGVQETLEGCQERGKRAVEELSTLPSLTDPGALRSALDGVPADLINKITTAEADTTTAGMRIATLHAEAGMGDDLLFPIPVPARAEADLLLQQEAEANALAKEYASEKRRLTKEARRDRATLDALLEADAPPTRADLNTARELRDRLWVSAAEDPAAFLAALAEADRISDRMFTHVEQSTRRQNLERRLAELTAESGDLADREAELYGRRSDLESAWGALWSDYPGAKPGYAAAAEVFDRIEQLRAATGELEQAKARQGAVTRQAGQHIRRLAELLPGVAEAAALHDPSSYLAILAELVANARHLVEEFDRTARERGILEDRIATADTDRQKAETRIDGTAKDLEAWSVRWNSLLGKAGLPADSLVETVPTILERLASAATWVDEASRASEQAAEESRRIGGYREQVTALADACRRPVPTEPSAFHQTMRELKAAAQEHRLAHERRERIRVEHNALNNDLDGARKALDQAEGELEQCAMQTGVTADALTEAIERHRRLISCEERLATVKDALPDETNLADLREQAAKTDRAALTEEIDELKATIPTLESQHADQLKNLALHEQEFRRLDGSAEAATKQADAEALASSVVSDVEEYLKLDLAAAYLRQCMEDCQQADNDPLLNRASGYFQAITEGRYTGLVLDPETDRPTIRARQTDGTTLAVNALSEGTSDQLYFALRLATLERHADEDRTMPLLVDDIFMTFDDDRTRAALTVLGELAHRFQIILFTHHTQVVAAAREAVPSARVHEHPWLSS